MVKKYKISEKDLNNIVSESIQNILKESFNDKKISRDIEDFGGLDPKRMKFGATLASDYDLQRSKMCGYLSRETVNELFDAELVPKLSKWLLFTNNGGAIVIEPNDEYPYYDNPWNKKVKERNQQWGEDGANKEQFQKDGWRRENSYEPIEINTVDRRKERKGMNIKK